MANGVLRIPDGVKTVRLKYVGHQAVGGHATGEKDNNFDGHKRYHGYDPVLQRDISCSIGQVVTMAEETADRYLDPQREDYWPGFELAEKVSQKTDQKSDQKTEQKSDQKTEQNAGGNK